MAGSAADPRQARRALERLIEPAGWAPFASLPPPAALLVLVPLLEELEQAALDPEERALRDRLLARNLLRLDPELTRPQAERGAQRHLRLQALRRAEELLLVQGDVDALVRWGEPPPALGLEHARQLAAAGGGALVVSAHLGPMALYAPLLAYCLSTRGGGGPAGVRPELWSVVNAPSSPRLAAQLERFAAHHGGRLGVLVKQPDGELALVRQLLPLLGRGAWVLMQLDVLSGGATVRPLPFAGGAIRLPAAWGAARLAAHCQVPLLPVLATRGPDGRPGLSVEPPLAPPPAASRRAVPTVLAGALAAQLERWVRQDPADWVMLPHLQQLAPEEDSR